MSGSRVDDVAVHVLVDGQRLDGWLETRDRREDHSVGSVRCRTAPAEDYLRCCARLTADQAGDKITAAGSRPAGGYRVDPPANRPGVAGPSTWNS